LKPLCRLIRPTFDLDDGMPPANGNPKVQLRKIKSATGQAPNMTPK
jgi:hypothetical protein